ncbi:MAG: hypothetical protein NXI30_20535 [bacterium]|nr:hypothetical protein [bacterium]
MTGELENGDGFVAIDEAECTQLLREERIGILGMLVDGEIEQRPINYAIHRTEERIRRSIDSLSGRRLEPRSGSD